MDNAVVLNKLESLRRCVRRVEEKTPPALDALATDQDLQDIIALNLERAIQVTLENRAKVNRALDAVVE